jgi:signal transduction histidine kinase
MSDEQHLEKALLRAVRDLSFARDLAHVTEVVRKAARRLTGADGVTFVLRDDGYCFYADEDAVAPLWKGKRFPMSACISGWVMLHRDTVALRDIYADERIPHDAYRPTFVKSLLMAPVRRDDPIAAIGAYWATEHEATAEERYVLETLADAASLALTNVELITSLERAVEREKEANQLKDQFLATVSHELRTPLNVMHGWLWQLQRPGVTPEKVKDGLEVLSRNIALQTRLVEDLLDVSRAVGGKLKIEPKLVDLGSLVRIVVEVARGSAEAKKLSLTFAENSSGTTFVAADGDRIQQIVWNLLSNAVKFTPTGGSIHVEVGRERSTAFISVQDTGAGISEEFLPRIFDPFRQEDGAPTRAYGGLGIGLTIVEQLTRLHGGHVSAHSDGVGKGTTVRVELPIPAVTTQASEWLKRRTGEMEAKNVPLDGLSVLVVDDEPDACDALRSILEYHGATVHVAGSANEALALAKHVTPNLILSDLAMPGMDGFELLRQLRSSANGAMDAPAAALSALWGDDFERQAKAAGYQLFLKKPVVPDTLTVQLARLAKQGLVH